VPNEDSKFLKKIRFFFRYKNIFPKLLWGLVQVLNPKISNCSPSVPVLSPQEIKEKTFILDDLIKPKKLPSKQKWVVPGTKYGSLSLV
jgi:hypothetical protein